MGVWKACLLLCALAVVGAGPALAATPLRVGAVEDAAKWSSPAAKMALAKQAGFGAVRMTAQWSNGLTAPSSADLAALQSAVSAAVAAAVEPIVSIYNVGSTSTP